MAFIVLFTLLAVFTRGISSQLVPIDNNTYFVGDKIFDKHTDYSQGYDMSKVFGESLSSLEPWSFVANGNFPCNIYLPYFWMVPEGYLREKDKKIKSMAVFEDNFLVYLSSVGIHFGQFTPTGKGLSVQNLANISISSEKYDYIKGATFGPNEHFVIANGYNGFSYAKVNLSALTISEFKQMLAYEFTQNMKITTDKDYLYIPGRRSGLHIYRLVRPIMELEYSGTVLYPKNEEFYDVADVAVISSNSANNTTTILVADYSKSLLLVELQLSTLETKVQQLEIKTPLGVGCYERKENDETINCLVIAEDKEGRQNLLEFSGPFLGTQKMKVTNMQMYMLNNAKYIKTLNNTAIIAGDDEYILMKKGWHKRLQAWTRYSEIELNLSVKNMTRIIIVYNNWIEVDKVRADYGNFYCFESVPEGVYNFNISAVSAKCILENDPMKTIENGDNCTYTARVRLYVSDQTYEDMLNNYASVKFFLIVCMVAFGVTIILCTILYARSRRSLVRYQALTGERSVSEEQEVVVEEGAKENTTSVQLQVSIERNNPSSNA